MFSLNNPLISYAIAGLVGLTLLVSAIAWIRADATATLRTRIAAETQVAQAQNDAVNAKVEAEGAAELTALLAHNAELEALQRAALQVIADHEGGATSCIVSTETIRALNASR